MTYPYEEFGQDRREIEALQRRLEAEIARLQKAKRHFSALADAKGKENCALRQENERLRAALAWYADKAQYEPGQDCEDIMIDAGATARLALEQTLREDGK